MERYTWTADQDEVIRGMILEGKTVADICDRMGCTDTQLKNHVAVVRRRDPSFPTLCGEVKGERFVLASSEAAAVLSGEPGQIVVESADEGMVEPIETEEKKVELNPLEKEMRDIIVENKETIEALRRDLSVEKEARAEEGKAYREEIERLKAACRAKDEELDKLRERAADLAGILARKREQDEAEARERENTARLKYMVRERNEVVYQIVKAIFVGPKEGSRE